MASTINADDGVVSGSAGVKTSADNSGVLELQSNGTTQFTLGSSSVVINEAGADVDFRVEGDTDANLLFVDASTNRVGVGTNAPLAKFQVGDGTATTEIRIDADGGSGAGGFIRGYKDTSNASWYFGDLNPIAGGTNDGLCAYAYGANPFTVFTNGLERLRVDSAGNLGLGVTPSAWGSGPAAQVGNVSVSSRTSLPALAQFSANQYWDGAAHRYISTAEATIYTQFNGVHSWLTAPSGTAGNTITFTQAMTLDASGNLLVGGTTAVYSAAGRGLVEINGSSNSLLGFTVGGADKGYILHGGTNLTISNSANGAMVFNTNATERARITSDGDLLVGTTSPLISSARRGLSVLAPTGTFVAAAFANDGGASAQAIDVWNKATTGNNAFVAFGTEASYTERGLIDYNRAAGLTRYNTTSDYRAKDILGPVQNSGATIDALKVYEGQMKGATQSRPMLVAHEAQEHAPYAVTGEKDAVNEDGTPKYQQMDVSALVPLLLAEIQSLRARVVALESK